MMHRLTVLSMVVLAMAVGQGCGGVGSSSQELALDCDELPKRAPNSLISPEEAGPRFLNEAELEARLEAFEPRHWHRVTHFQAYVEAEGGVTHACLYKSSGDPRFDEAALRAIGDARYRPASAGGEDVGSWVTTSLAFRVEAPPVQDDRFRPVSWVASLDSVYVGREATEIQVAVLEYLAENNHAHASVGPNRALCIGIGPDLPLVDPPPGIFDRFRSMDLPIHPASHCAVDILHSDGESSTPRLVLLETEQPAIVLWADIVFPGGADTVHLDAGYYEDGLSSAGYRCEAEKTPEGWRVSGCTLVSIS
ncbi:MAG: TonB family protein [Gemmatimonadetes bacterium]|nr:energy transducer TonB [Gemmatimonadota bacterium]NNM04583.1 TonB family protein [Gemmatimonadota bacterium]